jgi:hypothetical protein
VSAEECRPEPAKIAGIKALQPGARLDTHVTDWPLPKVVFADGRADKTVYCHDQLAEQLAITRPTTAATKADKSMARVASAVFALAAVSGSTVSGDGIPVTTAAAALAAVCSPATALVLTPAAPLSSSQVQYEALACCMASNVTELDEALPVSDSLLGGGSTGSF